MTSTAAPPLTNFSPKPRCRTEAHMSSPQRTGWPVRWACNLSGVRGTHVVTNQWWGGNTAMTIRG
jgi:hypothetical protein